MREFVAIRMKVKVVQINRMNKDWNRGTEESCRRCVVYGETSEVSEEVMYWAECVKREMVKQ